MMKSGKCIAFEYLALGIVCALVACALSLGLEEARYVPELNVRSRPFDNAWSILGTIWFAMVIHTLLPTGWVFWSGIGFAIKKKTAWFYLASAIPALAVGWLWPHAFLAFMSV